MCQNHQNDRRYLDNLMPHISPLAAPVYDTVELPRFKGSKVKVQQSAAETPHVTTNGALDWHANSSKEKPGQTYTGITQSPTQLPSIDTPDLDLCLPSIKATSRACAFQPRSISVSVPGGGPRFINSSNAPITEVEKTETEKFKCRQLSLSISQPMTRETFN